jgi:hypothetical protein
MACCKVMQYAIENDYLEELYSYADDKRRIPLGVFINKRNTPPLRLNLCPWCGTQQVVPARDTGGKA